jgi:hypothetical protein
MRGRGAAGLPQLEFPRLTSHSHSSDFPVTNIIHFCLTLTSGTHSSVVVRRSTGETMSSCRSQLCESFEMSPMHRRSGSAKPATHNSSPLPTPLATGRKLRRPSKVSSTGTNAHTRMPVNLWIVREGADRIWTWLLSIETKNFCIRGQFSDMVDFAFDPIGC